MFQSRRGNGGAKPEIAITGRDKSYPLEPLTKNPDFNRNGVSRKERPSREFIHWIISSRYGSLSLGRQGSDVLHQYHTKNLGSFDECLLTRSERVPPDNLIEYKKSFSRGPNPVHLGGGHGRAVSPEAGVVGIRLNSKASKCGNDIRSERDLRKNRFLKDFNVNEEPVKEVVRENGNKVQHSLSYSISTDSQFAADQMEGKFRNYVTQAALTKKLQPGGKQSGRKEETDTVAPANSPVRKIRKPTPVPLSVAPTLSLLQRPKKPDVFNKAWPLHSSVKSPVSRRLPSSTSKTQTTESVVGKNQGSLRLPSKPNVTTKSANTSDLISCRVCGRHFAPDRISTHEEICQKSTKTKRKPFDALHQRVKGTEVEKYVVKSTKNPSMNQGKTEKPQSNWRKKHEEFIKNIRAAKEVSAHLKKGGKLSDLPPPTPSDYSDYIQCPHCSRKFNSSAAERHIPKCANIVHNKPKTNTHKNASLKAAPSRNRK